MQIIFLVLFVSSHYTDAYNHDGSTEFTWTNWMSNFRDDRPLSRMSIPGTHDTMAIIGKASLAGSFIPHNVYTQAWTLRQQLQSGIRMLDIRVRCINGRFAIHHGPIYLNANLNDVLRDVTTFLSQNPSEAILMRLKKDHDTQNCALSFSETFGNFYWLNPSYSDFFWKVRNTPNPTLGQIRGKIVVLYDGPDPWEDFQFGLQYNTFDTQDQYNLDESFDNYDKWLAIKAQLVKANGAPNQNRITINYLTASSSNTNPFTQVDRHYPCFVASGHNDCNTGGNRRWVNSSFDLPKSLYPDFPRDDAGHILYEGMNILTWQWITSNGPSRVGIVMADFPGFGLVGEIIRCNRLDAPQVTADVKRSKLVTLPTRGNFIPGRMVCYWGSWSHWRTESKFNAENIDPSLCTHLLYGFAKLNDDFTVGAFDVFLDLDNDPVTNPGGLGMYRKVVNLKNSNPNLKVLIAIGGWSAGSDRYSQMAANPSLRSTFVNSVLPFLNKHRFDGIDLDWEYPGWAAAGDGDRTPGNPNDKQNFIALLRELRPILSRSGRLLTAAVAAGKDKIDRAYDVPQMNGLLDFMNVMTYDFHGSWESVTGQNAPLYQNPNDNELNRQYTTEFAIKYWIQLGADPSKLNMGIPVYGRTFTLSSSTNFVNGAPASGAGLAGSITKLPGILAYSEYCRTVVGEEYTVWLDDVPKVKYAVKNNQWIGLDDMETVGYKLDFLINNNLGGAMIWSIEMDDFNNQCGGGNFPLLNMIKFGGLRSRRARMTQSNHFAISNNTKSYLVKTRVQHSGVE